MKARFGCFQCLSSVLGDCQSAGQSRIDWITIDDSGYVEVTCHKGHVSLVALQNPRFDLLYESAAYALIDGYPRESVASFAAAVERYFEFHLLTIFLKQGRLPAEFDRVWKPIAKSSERQFGAYLAAHELEFAVKAPSLPTKPDMQRFRNDVIHNGKFPSDSQALEFGECVLSVIRNGLGALRELDQIKPGIIAQASVTELTRRRPAKFQGRPTVTTGLITIANPAIISPKDQKLADALVRLRNHRELKIVGHDPNPR